jgi:predicted ATP-binding protein involved in virulence
MHLQRIQVPDFRVLQDVDITFEKEFVPSIFPLGSLNGGGKSTLLQLIFVLLHCSNDPDKIRFLKNMLNGFKIHKNYKKEFCL